MKDTHVLIGMGVLAIAIIASVYLMVGGTAFQIQTQTGQGQAGGTTVTGGVTLCDTNGQGVVRFNALNAENTASNTYLSYTARVYRLNSDNTVGPYVKSVTVGTYSDNTNITALPCGFAYRIYLPADDGASTPTDSGVTSGFIDTPVLTTSDLTLPDYRGTATETALQFKVWDLDNANWVYPYFTGTANTWMPSTTNFYSTTDNLTGTTVGSGGRISYEISVETNSTTSTVSRFDDQQLAIVVDTGNGTMWGEPSITYAYPSGASLSKQASVAAISPKLASDLYDWAYIANLPHDGNGNVIHLTDTPAHKFDISVNALTNQNPSGADTIKFGLATSGYFQETLGSAMKVNFNKDDASQTSVYTTQYIGLKVV